MFQGVYTALITPFKNKQVDEKAFQSFVEWQVAEGIDGLVPTGTTGESPTLTHEEHERVVELCIEAAGGKVPVIAGTGSNSTDEAIALTQHAENAGATAALLVTPYYNKPTEAGLWAHFKAIHDATKLPIILYNIPGRSVINMSDALIAKLAGLPRIVGIKDATGNLERPASLRLLVDKDFCQLSGEDPTALAFNALGGRGCISVTSNIAPKLCAELQKLWFAGKHTQALAVHDTLMPLHQAMFCETSPGPVKYAASLLGKCSPELRLPLVEPGEDTKRRIEKVVKASIQ